MPGEWQQVRIGKDLYEQRVSYVDEKGKTHYEYRALPKQTEGTEEEDKTYSTPSGAKGSKKKAKEETYQEQIEDWEKFKKEHDLKESKSGVISGPGFAIHPSYGPPEERGKLIAEHLGLTGGSPAKGKVYSSGIRAQYIGMDEEIDLGLQPRSEIFPIIPESKIGFEIERQAGREAGLEYLAGPGLASGKIKAAEASYEFYMSEFEKEREEIRRRWAGEEGIPGHLEEFGRFLYTGTTPENLLFHQQIGEVLFGEEPGKGERILTEYTHTWMALHQKLKISGYEALAYEPFMPGGLGFTVGTAAAFGYGITALKTVFPFAGKTVEIGAIGYGAYQVGSKIKDPLLAAQYGAVGKELTKVGVTLPLFIVGYAAGAKVGGAHAVGIMKEKGIEPISWGSTFYRRINPLNILRNVWTKAGAEEIPTSEFIDPSVLKGAKTFPESHPSVTFKQFKASYDPVTGKYIVVHGTGEKFGVGEISSALPKRGTDVFGLYVTPYRRASAHFTRLQDPGAYTTEFGIFPKLSKPSFRQFYVGSVGRAPRSVRFDISKFRSWQLTGKGADVTITPAHEMMLKLETEGVIKPASLFESIKQEGLLATIKGYSKYTKYKGRNIPIYEYDLGIGGKDLSSIFVKQAADLQSYISGLSDYHPYVSPYTVSLSSLISSIGSPSKIPSSSVKSYKQSYEYSYEASLISSAIPSVISSKTPSVKKSKSYIPSTISTPSIISSPIPSKKVISETYIPTPDYSFTEYPPPPERKKRKKSQEDLLKKAFEVPKAFRHRVHPVELIEVNL